MESKVKELVEEVGGVSISNPDQAEQFRLKYLSKKGVLADLFEEFKTLAPEQRKVVGKQLNELKQMAEKKFAEAKETTSAQNGSSADKNIDLSLPSEPIELGSRHPISLVRASITDIFTKIGFTISEGPEIEDDWHNFGALNFPEDHPARDMQDTFFVESDSADKWLLRTHTSSVQVRVMKNQKPPIRTISPGRVYRNETISARAHCQFHQVEGLYVDEGVSFADLKQTLYYFVQEMFGEKINIRFRPSFFPFTEPSAEMDISCIICGGIGCPVCKQSGWVEILGCGMVHPNVLENCGIDSKKYTGYAFGMGIERIAMLRFQIKDLRLFFENDMRFLSQFKSVL
ncbi:MAG TPA: phenylalanine--tRNA ligase subunit alpha [Bacteroidia bacterium]|jgi:phenylalanyl-tRNA synthetase alpha chain|nr:phenylalanine--tRNA ligase subunit alpha [Bacteroidia bacterium]